MTERNRGAAAVFAALCVVSGLVVACALVWAKARNAEWMSERRTDSASDVLYPVRTVATDFAPRQIYYRYTGLGPHFGRLTRVDYAQPDQIVFLDQLSCETLHVARDRGICLSADRGVVTTYEAKLFDARTYEVHAVFGLGGVPSRTRLSPDGSLGATTVFVTGHGYDSVDFSTQTLLIDIDREEVIADLETFSVKERGVAVRNADFNFWGVTFLSDANTFYATLSTGGRHMLVRGDIGAKTAEVVHENVECPSLSPDGTRVAYKKRFVTDGRVGWRLHVLHLNTAVETSLSEERSVDDQLEWFDDEHVLYSVRGDNPSAGATTDVWVAAADGSGNPQLFLRNAYSPSVVR